MAHQDKINKFIVQACGLFAVGKCLASAFQVFNKTLKQKLPDYEQFRSKLGWIPLETVKATFAATTQLAMNVPLCFPLCQHVRSCFPQLNWHRLAETFATDTMFSSVASLGGSTCVQLYCGQKSFFTAAYGMKTESEGPESLEDFVREVGAPHCIHNDNSKMQTGVEWNKILCKYNIAAENTEPDHPEQNPAEHRIKTVKHTTSKIMDRTGAPVFLWLLCLLYVVYLLNWVAMDALGGRTPIEVALGETPDISALLQFDFYKPVLYHDPEGSSFPDTTKKPGQFMGIAENKGDNLTYWILTDNKQVIARSVVHPANHESKINQCIQFEDVDTC